VITVISTIVVWVVAIACAVAGIRAHLGTRKLKRITKQLNDRLQQAAEDRSFALWANWTMLTVTDTKGYVHAGTLRQIYTTGRWDAVWEAPIAVALWHGDPDVVHRYQAELGQEEKRSG
jgi:hypothetical protein